MFAEGVLSRRIESGRNPVLYAGVDSKDPKKEPDILWYPHPKFWHYIESGDGAIVSANDKVTESLKSQLARTRSNDEVFNIITKAFILKFHHKLQVSSTKIILPDTVLLELGIDSLVAVDIRAWFVTELSIDMPILKILEGSSIIDLITDAVGRLTESFLPGLEIKQKVKASLF